MTAAAVAGVVAGDLVGFGEALLTGADVDSRRLRTGDLFVALPGSRHDGHDFVPEALEVASAALVRRNVEVPPLPDGRALIRVEDPLPAMWQLARHEREKRGWRIVAITGSVAKTTVKEYVAQLASPFLETGRTRGNRNNTLGLPGQLLSQPPPVAVFVAEAGMSRPGELDTLGGILEPLQVLVYTTISVVHTEFLGDLDGIVRAKAELLPYLHENGTLVVNGNDPHQTAFVDRVTSTVLSYGAPGCAARLEDLEDRGLLGTRFRLVLPGGSTDLELPIPGRHQAENFLAAATAVTALGLTVDQVATAASGLRAAPHRGRLVQLHERITLIDDSYNSSPLAATRMLELLAMSEGRRVAVLGEMYELGELAAEAHRAAGVESSRSCDLLVAVGGDDARELAQAARDGGLASVHHVPDATAAAEALLRLLEPGDVVLVKGSRGVGLDRAVAAIAGEEAA